MSATDKFFRKNYCILKITVLYCIYQFREAITRMRSTAAQFYFCYYYFYATKK